MKESPNKGVKLLRKFMEKKKKNQNEISYLVNISPEHASRLMAGKFRPSLELAVLFETHCGIPPRAWLERG